MTAAQLPHSPRPVTGNPFPGERNRSGRRGVLGAAAALLAFGAAPAIAAPQPDARLIALCDALVAGSEEMNRLWEPYLESVGFIPPDIDAQVAELVARHHRLVPLIARLPARTREGLAAKVRVMRDLLGEADDLEEAPELVARSIVGDLSRLGVV